VTKTVKVLLHQYPIVDYFLGLVLHCINFAELTGWAVIINIGSSSALCLKQLPFWKQKLKKNWLLFVGMAAAASDFAYCYTFLCSVVCSLSVTIVHPAW